MGSPPSYSAFPYLALGLAAAAAVIGWLRVRRDPRAGAGEGAESPAT